MGSNSTMAYFFKWLLFIVSMVTVQGFSPQESAGFKLTMTQDHFLQINARNNLEVNLTCVLRNGAGQPVPLAGCGYRNYYAKDTMQFNEGPASPNYTLSDGQTGKYQGRGLEHGECGLTFGGNWIDYVYILGCRVKPLTGGWQTAASSLYVTDNLPMQYHLEPQVKLALAGSEVTLQGKAEHELDDCRFILPPVDDTVLLDFTSGPASAHHSLGRYHGAGLDKKECGITLTNVQAETNGFVRGEVNSSSSGSASVDFIELIVMSAPDDVGMTNTTTSEDGIFRATCWSKNSRPVANITWLLDDQVIRQDSTNAGEETEWFWDHDPQSITQHLQRKVTREDNGKQLVCRVGHMALPLGRVDYSESVTVLFPPDRVTMTQDPSELKLGALVTFTCESGSSNPPATHTWYRDETRLNSSITSTEPGQYNGQLSTSNLTLNLTVDMRGAVVMCQASYDQLYKINTTTKLAFNSANSQGGKVAIYFTIASHLVLVAFLKF